MSKTIITTVTASARIALISILLSRTRTVVRVEALLGVTVTKEKSEMSPTEDAQPGVKQIQIHWICSIRNFNTDITFQLSFSGISDVLLVHYKVWLKYFVRNTKYFLSWSGIQRYKDQDCTPPSPPPRPPRCKKCSRCRW